MVSVSFLLTASFSFRIWTSLLFEFSLKLSPWQHWSFLSFFTDNSPGFSLFPPFETSSLEFFFLLWLERFSRLWISTLLESPCSEKLCDSPLIFSFSFSITSLFPNKSSLLSPSESLGSLVCGTSLSSVNSEPITGVNSLKEVSPSQKLGSIDWSLLRSSSIWRLSVPVLADEILSGVFSEALSSKSTSWLSESLPFCTGSMLSRFLAPVWFVYSYVSTSRLVIGSYSANQRLKRHTVGQRKMRALLSEMLAQSKLGFTLSMVSSWPRPCFT